MSNVQPITAQPDREPGAAVGHIIIGSPLVNERPSFVWSSISIMNITTDSGNGGPWEWRPLGMAAPGNGGLIPSQLLYIRVTIFLPSKTWKLFWENLELKLYYALVVPVLLYGSECWSLRKEDERRLLVAEMSWLRRIIGRSRREKVRNEQTREELEETVVQKIKERRLQWFGTWKGWRRKDYQMQLYMDM